MKALLSLPPLLIRKARLLGVDPEEYAAFLIEDHERDLAEELLLDSGGLDRLAAGDRHTGPDNRLGRS